MTDLKQLCTFEWKVGESHPLPPAHGSPGQHLLPLLTNGAPLRQKICLKKAQISLSQIVYEPVLARNNHAKFGNLKIWQNLRISSFNLVPKCF